MKTVTLELPLPPSVNEYWLHTKTGHTYISEEGRNFRRDVGRALYSVGSPRLNGPVAVNELVFFMRDRRGHNIDNRIKPLLDALQDQRDKKSGFVLCGLYEDDVQVRELNRVIFGPVIKGGKVRLTISEMPMALFPEGTKDAAGPSERHDLALGASQ